ncbi:sugar isomerase [Thermosipho affectus]|uniref:Sugar isomerase n=1 Tax=Thermosipho affectus TaxID=660294 RepID=A0ABX3IKP7_9BACT|nr:SIS domain-containing protein [Thermosipho affectus]ONN27117.1 sugar isomerase [Thermosipho affectus]
MNYTYNEIMRTPELLKKIENYSIEFSSNKKYVFVGCGSSYNLAFTASKILKVNSETLTGGKILALDYTPKCDIGIFISRTGESTETVLSAEKFKKNGILTIGITCEKNSSLEKVCDQTFTFDFLHEESIVMTGSFTAILYFLIKNGEISNMAKKIIEKSNDYLEKIDLKKYNHFVFLGFDEEYGISKEGALKIQEMAKQFVEFHEPLEYRHGPISKLTDKTLVIINSKDTKYEHTLKKDLEKYTKVIYLGKDGDIDIKYNSGFETPLRVIFLQILAYKKAISEGLNPDRPENLSKSVKI